MTNNPDIVLDRGVKVAEEKFLDFIQQPEAISSLSKFFGIDQNFLLSGSLLLDNLSSFKLPNLEIRAEAEINNAFGAYSSDTNTIYISEEFLLSSFDNSNAVADVILEEWGHYLDNQINLTDTPGDEGAIFASLATEEVLSSDELIGLQTEDDTATIYIDGENITIEQNDGGVNVPPLPGRIIYVNQNATGNNDGTSWSNAYTDLSSALEAAGANNEVWVAQGTYFPTTDGDREQSFVIADGAEVYGGFAGTETERSQRDVLNNQVTLSGDIGVQGDRADNSYNVVLIQNNPFPTVLDGFTILDGQADGGSFNEFNTFSRGAGIHIDNSSDVNLSNLIIANNLADNGGGGIYQRSSNSNLNNIAFLNNIDEDISITDDDSGGAFESVDSTGTVTNSLFVNNQAQEGSAVYISSSEERFNITNSTFVGNAANTGTIYVSGDIPVNIENSIFASNPTSDNSIVGGEQESITINNSIVQGGFNGTGENIIDADPLFVDFNNNNYSLQEGSPAIDAGNNAVIEGINTDLVGNPRITNDTVDIGAYELVLTEDDMNPPPPEDNPDPGNGGEIPEGSTVYRFLNNNTGVHFYTADEAERNNILENLPQYNPEGASYISAPESDSLTGVAPVYRFLNTDTGVHLYTISEAERDSIQQNLPNYELEGVAYYGYTEPQEGTTPLYRFYNPAIDAHFYTPSTAERDNIIANLPEYELENNNGIAFYVQPLGASDPVAPPTETPEDNSLAIQLSEILNQLDS